MSAFADFIRSVRGGYAQGRSEEMLLFGVSEALQELLQDKTFLADFGLPIEREYQTYTLYEDPRYGFLVTASTSRDGLYRPAHDHGPTWAVYGVYTGDIRMQRYRRVDDRQREGYAELETVAEFVAGPGSVDAIMPGGIHELWYSGDGAISVIARSADHSLMTRGRYKPEERRVEMFQGVSTGGSEQRVDLRHLAPPIP